MYCKIETPWKGGATTERIWGNFKEGALNNRGLFRKIQSGTSYWQAVLGFLLSSHNFWIAELGKASIQWLSVNGSITNLIHYKHKTPNYELKDWKVHLKRKGQDGEREEAVVLPICLGRVCSTPAGTIVLFHSPIYYASFPVKLSTRGLMWLSLLLAGEIDYFGPDCNSEEVNDNNKKKIRKHRRFQTRVPLPKYMHQCCGLNPQSNLNKIF